MWGQVNRARGQRVQESGEVRKGENRRGKARMGPECCIQGTSSGAMEEEPGLTFCLERGAQLERQEERDLWYLRGDALGSSLGVTAAGREAPGTQPAGRRGRKTCGPPPSQFCLTVARRRAGLLRGRGFWGRDFPPGPQVPDEGHRRGLAKRCIQIQQLVASYHSLIHSSTHSFNL